MRGWRRWIAVAGAAAALVGCAPPPGPATSDTLDLGEGGRYSEPDVVVSARTVDDFSPRGPRSTTLVVTVADADGNVLHHFDMREDNVFGPVTPAAVGDFPGILAPPNVRRFVIAHGASEVSSPFGRVTITEIATGDLLPGSGGPAREVTRLRASFSGLFEGIGFVQGYLTIG